MSDFQPLLLAVESARGRVATERHKLAPDPTARRDLAEALGAYVSALEVSAMPVPYRLRDELRLQQRVLGVDRVSGRPLARQARPVFPLAETRLGLSDGQPQRTR